MGFTKPELVAKVAAAEGITKAAAGRIVNHTFQLVAEAIEFAGRFEFAGFGIFKKVRRKATDRPNPQDRTKKVHTPAFNTVKFKPSPALKALVK